MSNIATLGFDFQSSTAVQEIEKVAEALRKIKEQNGDSQKSVNDFLTFKDTGLLTNVKKDLEGLKTALESLRNKDTFSGLTLLSSSLSKIKPINQESLSSLDNLFAVMQKTPSAIPVNVANSMVSIGDAMSHFTHNINPTVTTGLDNLFTVMQKVPQKIPADLTNSLKGIAEATNNLSPLNKSVTDGIRNLFIAMQNPPQNFPAGLGESIRNVAEGTRNMPLIPANVSEGIKNLFSAMQNPPQNIPSGLGGNLQSLAESTKNFKPVTNAVTDGIKNLFLALQNPPPSISANLPDVLRNLGEATKTITEVNKSVTDGIRNLFIAMQNPPQNIPAGLGESIRNIAEGTRNMPLIPANVSEGIKNLFSAMQNPPQNIPSGLGGNLQSLAESTKNFKPVTNAVTDGIKNLFLALQNPPPSISANLAETIRSLGESTKNLTEVNKSVTNGIQSLFASLQNPPQNFPAGLGQNIKDLAEATKNMTAIKENVPANLASLFDALKKAPANISMQAINGISSLSTATGTLKTIEKSTIDNLERFFNVIQKMKPINQESLSSLDNLFAVMQKTPSAIPVNVANSMVSIGDSLSHFKYGINSTVTTGLDNLFTVLQKAPQTIPFDFANTLKGLSEATKNLSPVNKSVTNGIQNLFASMQNPPQAIPVNLAETIRSLGESTKMLSPVNKSITSGIQSLFASMQNPPQNFPAGLGQNIKDLADATKNMTAIKKGVPANLASLFDALKKAPANISMQAINGISSLSTATGNLKTVKKSTIDNLERFFNVIQKMKPIDPKVLSSLNTVGSLLEKMGLAARSAKVPLNNANNYIGNMIGNANNAAIAFRAFTGAFSVKALQNAAQSAIDLSTQLAYIKSIANELDLTKLKNGLMNFDSLLGDPAKNAEALYYAYSSGIRGTEEDFLRFTEVARKTSMAIRSSMIPTVDAMTAAMNAYGKTAGDVVEISDLFSAIVKQGKASGEQLASGLGQVTPTAATLGLTLDELGAAISSLTKVQPTRIAITSLNNMLSKIMKPTKESRLALEKLGVEMNYTAVQSKGFATVMEELKNALNGNMEAIKNIFPDIRGQRAAMHLLGVGFKDFNQQLDYFANKSGETERQVSALVNDINVQLGYLPVTFDKVATEAGLMFNRILTLDGSLAPVIAAINNMSDAERKLIAGISAGAGMLFAYKAMLVAINTWKVMEIKNNQILAAQSAAENMQGAKSIGLKNAARALKAGELYQQNLLNTANKQALVIQAEKTRQEIASTKASLAYNYAMLQRVMVQRNANYLTHYQNNIQILKNRLLAKEAALLQTNTALTMEYNAAQKLQAAGGTQATIIDIAKTGKGFNAGFRAMLGFGDTASRLSKDFVNFSRRTLVAYKGFAKFQKLMEMSWKGLVKSFQVGMTGLGAVAGKITAVIASILSPFNIIVGSLAAIGLTAIDYARSFSMANEHVGKFDNSIVANLMFKLVTAIDDGVKNGEEAVKRMEKIFELKKMHKEADNWAKNQIQSDIKSYKSVFDSQLSEQEQFNKMVNDYNQSVANFHSAGVYNNQLEAQQKAVQEANKKYQAAILQNKALVLAQSDLSREAWIQRGIRSTTVAIASIATLGAALAPAWGFALKFETEGYKNAKMRVEKYARFGDEYVANMKKQFEKEQKIFTEMTKKRQGTIGAMKNNAASMLKWSEAVIKNVDETRKAFAQIKFSNLTKEEQYKQELGSLNGMFAELTLRMKSGVAKGTEKGFTTTLTQYGNLYKSFMANLQKRIEDAVNFDKELKNLTSENALKFASSEQKKNKLLTSQASGYKDVYEKMLKKDNLAEAFTAMKNYQRVSETLIASQQKLAEAERKANEETIKLIQSMDKFKSWSVKGIDARSTDALKLQTRQFNTLPKISPLQTQQNSMQEQNKNLAKSLEDMVKQLTARNEKNKNDLMATQKSQQDNMNLIMGKTEPYLDKIEKHTKSLLDQTKKAQTLEIVTLTL